MRRPLIGWTASLAALLLGAAGATGCGEDQPPPPPPEHKTHEVHAAAPADLAPPASERVALPAAIERLGVRQDGVVVAAAGGLIYEVRGASLEPRPLFAAGGDPTSLGAVHGISPRRAGGAWVAAENGLFLLDGPYVSKSPIVPAGGGAVYATTDVGTGPLAGLWFAAEQGLFRHRSAEEMARLRIDGQPDAARGIALDPEGRVGLAHSGGAPAALLLDGDALVSEAPPKALGVAAQVAGLPGAVLAAGDRGLVRYRSQDSLPWAHFPLAADAAQPVATVALAVDPVANVAWARSADRLLRLEGDAVSAFALAATPGSAAAGLAVDAYGDVWAADGADLVRLKLGVGSLDLSFEQDVKPWLQAHCTRCHADFTGLAQFSPRAENAFARVQQGDMPRCEGGVPCPTADKLAPSQYAALEAWIRGGKKP